MNVKSFVRIIKVHVLLQLHQKAVGRVILRESRGYIKFYRGSGSEYLYK